jgi:molecular chaperone GrpE
LRDDRTEERDLERQTAPDETGPQVDGPEGNTPVAEIEGEILEEQVEPTLEEQLAAAEAKAAEYLDGWQRARAEFANARKRLERERMEAYKNAAVDYAAKLLPVLDDFDRAIISVPTEIEENSWFAGIILVQRKLHAILDGFNIERIEALGQPFDPNLHEALALKEAEGVESGTIIEELQPGYRMGDRVIRPSLVNVAA